MQGGNATRETLPHLNPRLSLPSESLSHRPTTANWLWLRAWHCVNADTIQAAWLWCVHLQVEPQAHPLENTMVVALICLEFGI